MSTTEQFIEVFCLSDMHKQSELLGKNKSVSGVIKITCLSKCLTVLSYKQN